MRTQLIRQSGQPGTGRLVAAYGAKLICVRSRDNEDQGRRRKAVEWIVAEMPYILVTVQCKPQTIADLQEGLYEYEVQRLIKDAHGKGTSHDACEKVAMIRLLYWNGRRGLCRKSDSRSQHRSN